MATHDDATLLVQILQWSSAAGIDDAMRQVYEPDFVTNPTTDEEVRHPAAGKVLSFGETVGTLVKQKVLDRDLLLDLVWVEGLWARVGAYAKAIRAGSGEPRLYENFEALAAPVR